MGLLGLVIFAAARWLPVEKLPFWGCTVRELTGWPCLGCGLTRSAQHLAHGEPGAALAINPLGTILFIMLGAAVVASVGHLVFGLAPPQLHLGRCAARTVRLALAGAVALNYTWVIWHTAGVLG